MASTVVCLLCCFLLTTNLVSGANSGLECLKNKECNTRSQHFCNIQTGLWVKSYVMVVKNESLVIASPDSLESCSCCFSPDLFRQKVTERGLLETIGLTLESEEVASLSKLPCSTLRKPCIKTLECCSGYCSRSEENETTGTCYDPMILSENDKFPVFAERTRKERKNMRHNQAEHHLFSSSEERKTERTSTGRDQKPAD